MSEPVRSTARKTLHEVLLKNEAAMRELALDARARALAQAATLPEDQFEPLLKIIELVRQHQISTGALSATAHVLEEMDWVEPRSRGAKSSPAESSEAALELVARIRSALFEEAVLASCVTSQEAASRLGVSRSTIEKLPEECALALGGPGRGRRYPAWQFQKGQPRRTVPGLDQVLLALEGTPLRKAVWLSTPRAAWSDRAASDLLQEGDYQTVLDYVRAASVAL